MEPSVRRFCFCCVSVLLVTASLLAQRRPEPNPRPGQPPPPGRAPFGEPLQGLGPEERLRFDEGLQAFRRDLEAADGLGPVFNAASCRECHAEGGIGGGDSGRFVTRFGRLEDGRFDPLIELGGMVIQERGVGRVDTLLGSHTFGGERVPREANLVVRRRSIPVFGLGLIGAVPDGTLLELARGQAANPDGAAGRPHLVTDPETGRQAVGRFGWKAIGTTVRAFGAGALVNELGISNPIFPDEMCPQGDCAALDFNPAPAVNDGGRLVDAISDYMTLLAPPGRGPIGPDERDGEVVFRQIGCDSCHVPSLETGPSPIAALDRVRFEPFSDFLLHDMGTLGDGIVEGNAGGREMRTAPLWGLRVMRRFLHDGRAATLDEAILQHDGQGRRSRERFAGLDARDRERLLAFLRSL